VLLLVTLFGFTLLIGQLLTFYNGNPDAYFTPVNFVIMSTFAGQSLLFVAGMLLAQFPDFLQGFHSQNMLQLLEVLDLFYLVYHWFVSRKSNRSWHKPLARKSTFLYFVALFYRTSFYGLMSQRTKLQSFYHPK